MYVKLFREPELNNPILIAGWSGMGGVGVIAVDTIRLATVAERFAEIAPRNYGMPLLPLSFGAGIMKNAEFPTNSFYYHKSPQNDLIFFVGQAPPRTASMLYETGKMVLELAQRFGCKRVYVTGATVSRVHHTADPRVWASTNHEALLQEVKDYPNTYLMSEKEPIPSHGKELFGLYSIVLEEAKQKGIDGICLLGELPTYISRFPHTPYPKASRPIVKVLTTALGMDLDLSQFDDLINPMEENINKWVNRLPAELKAEIDELRRSRSSGPITEDDKKQIMEDLDNFFKSI